MMDKQSVVALLAGVALAVPYVMYARRVRYRAPVFGIGLVIAALIYIVFAAIAGTRNDLLMELVGLILFAVIAGSGVRYSSAVVALGWVAHVGWDLLLHPIDVSSHVPWWYPVACIGFDLLVAGAILATTQWRDDAGGLASLR